MFVYPPTGRIFSLQHFNVSLFEAQLTTINLDFYFSLFKVAQKQSSLNWFDAKIFGYQPFLIFLAIATVSLSPTIASEASSWMAQAEAPC